MPAEIFAPLALACALLVMIQYYRVSRLMAGIGWSLIILAIGAFGSGLGQSFTWSGLAFLAVGVLGLIVLAEDAIFRRFGGRRQRGDRPAQADSDRGA